MAKNISIALSFVIFCLISGLAGVQIGSSSRQAEIARECRYGGGFVAKHTAFKCERVSKNGANQKRE